jgi:hypothetical protein
MNFKQYFLELCRKVWQHPLQVSQVFLTLYMLGSVIFKKVSDQNLRQRTRTGKVQLHHKSFIIVAQMPRIEHYCFRYAIKTLSH